MQDMYSILALKSGEFTLGFRSMNQFVNEIERNTGIRVRDQTYYCNGKKEDLHGILKSESNFQVIANESSFQMFSRASHSSISPRNRTIFGSRNEMKIFVKNLKLETLTFHISRTALIEQLKEIIHESEDIPPDQQRIIFEGK